MFWWRKNTKTHGCTEIEKKDFKLSPRNANKFNSSNNVQKRVIGQTVAVYKSMVGVERN